MSLADARAVALAALAALGLPDKGEPVTALARQAVRMGLPEQLAPTSASSPYATTVMAAAQVFAVDPGLHFSRSEIVAQQIHAARNAIERAADSAKGRRVGLGLSAAQLGQMLAAARTAVTELEAEANAKAQLYASIVTRVRAFMLCPDGTVTSSPSMVARRNSMSLTSPTRVSADSSGGDGDGEDVIKSVSRNSTNRRTMVERAKDKDKGGSPEKPR